MRRVRTGSDRTKEFVEQIGNALVDFFHLLALFAIGGTVVWSAAFAFIGMAAKGHATVEDILLLFIYLELGAMVGIYFKTNHMPVRFLLYVAITALTRLRYRADASRRDAKIQRNWNVADRMASPGAMIPKIRG